MKRHLRQLGYLKGADANKLSKPSASWFHLSPSDKDYWNHGYSTESDFIFVTTNAMTYEALNALSEKVGAERSLMVFQGLQCRPLTPSTISP